MEERYKRAINYAVAGIVSSLILVTILRGFYEPINNYSPPQQGQVQKVSTNMNNRTSTTNHLDNSLEIAIMNAAVRQMMN